MKEDDSIELLIEKLLWLRLPGMAAEIRAILELAAADNLSTLDVIHRLADEEKDSRIRNAIKRRINNAKFPEVNTIDAFDFGFDVARKQDPRPLSRAARPELPRQGHQPALHRQARHRQDLPRACLGLSRMPSHQACGRRPRPKDAQRPAWRRASRLPRTTPANLHPRRSALIDDFAVLEMDPAQAKLAFQVISERYDHRRSTAITTNRAFKDWPKVFPDALNAQVIAERLTERAEHFVMNGKSYRTKR